MVPRRKAGLDVRGRRFHGRSASGEKLTHLQQCSRQDERREQLSVSHDVESTLAGKGAQLGGSKSATVAQKTIVGGKQGLPGRRADEEEAVWCNPASHGIVQQGVRVVHMFENVEKHEQIVGSARFSYGERHAGMGGDFMQPAGMVADIEAGDVRKGRHLREQSFCDVAVASAQVEHRKILAGDVFTHESREESSTSDLPWMAPKRVRRKLLQIHGTSGSSATAKAYHAHGATGPTVRVFARAKDTAMVPHVSMSKLEVVLAVVAVIAVPQVAAAQNGPEIGVRTGYAFAAGHTGALANSQDQNLSDYISGQLPIWIDAGFRFLSSYYVGGYFQYGFASINDDRQTICRNANVDCSASDVRIGVMGRYTFMPGTRFSPWVGLGTGYEWATLSVHESIVSTTSDSTWSGFEFANLQVGGDYRVGSRFIVAPFISLSFGQFRHSSLKTSRGSGSTTQEQGIAKESIHEWILLGVRAAFMP